MILIGVGFLAASAWWVAEVVVAKIARWLH
jgi:hypothetical protein